MDDERGPESYIARVTGSTNVQIGSHNTQHNVTVDAGTLPPPQHGDGTGRAPHNLPAQSAVFEGRDITELSGLLDDARAGVVVGQAALHGLGGIGKSELANQYARARLDHYRLVWWITAESRESVTLGLTALTRRLHPMPTAADAREWALGWLQSHPGWLLILDNVEDLADIAGLLGVVSGSGHLLVTTRRDLGARWRRLGLHALRLEVLDRAASVRVLTDLTGLDDPGGAGLLADALGDLPLGLQQASAYVSQHEGMTFADYARLLAEEFDRTADAAGEGEGDPGGRTVAAVWTVTMAAIARRSPLAVAVMEVLAWFGADELPERVLTPLSGDPGEVTDALALLASYSMVGRRAGSVTTHRLVQAVTRGAATTAGRSDAIRESAIRLLAEAAPDDPVDDVTAWPLWAALTPHVQAVGERVPGGQDLPEMLGLREMVATYLQYQGNLSMAVVLHQRVVSDSERRLGAGHPDTLAARGNLATCYMQAGRTDEALALHEQVVADSYRALGADHADVLAAGNNLAACYLQADRAGEAVPLLEEVVTESDRLLGADHPDTLTARGNLAAAYLRQGRVDEAITLVEQVAADFERRLGAGHPDTLAARGNLAGFQAQAGRTGAVAFHERVVADSERLLGADHPDTLTARNNLAAAHLRKKHIAEAISIAERVTADSERLLGPGHPVALTAREHLAQAFWADGRLSEALRAEEETVEHRRRFFGPDDPATLAACEHLALSYWRAERRDDAIVLKEQIVQSHRRLVGDHHPATLAARADLAGCYWMVSRREDAVALQERVVADRRFLRDDTGRGSFDASVILWQMRAAMDPSLTHRPGGLNSPGRETTG
ncbi:tetratricopeptide repeat protein [Actinoplanes sp. NPDC051861]|uniref:tetratricopeptide repeat protein n=1 Tax=Actinoplanes sp. NPDC051861 TaxID=3155170 RepID=UPI00343F57F2